MFKALELLVIGFRLLPTIVEAIMFAEKLYGPDPDRGGEKLALIRETLEDVYKLDQDGDGLPDIDKLWSFIESRIARIVARFNERGWPPLPEHD